MFDDGEWAAYGEEPWPPEPAFDEPPADPVAEAVGWARTRNASDGQIALAVDELLRTTSAQEALSARTLVAAEIGAALAVGSGAADTLVDTVIALRSRLRLTFAAVVRGDLDWYKAVVLAQATAALTDEQARAVEENVLGKAAGRTPARHADAVRRAVARIDPDGAAARRREARRTVALIRAHHGDGMGELFATMASEHLDTVYQGADLWARARKADGDPRTLDQLRVASLVQWAQSFLHHGDPTYCDRWCTPGSHHPTGTNSHGDTDNDEPDDHGPDDSGPDDSGPHGDDGRPRDAGGPEDNGPDDAPPDDGIDGGSGPGADGGTHHTGPRDHSDHSDHSDHGERPPSRPPTRHGRPAALAALWDLHSLLGLTSRCGELADSGAVLPPDAMAELVAGGLRIRRMIIDDATGELLDLTPRSWPLPRTAATELDAPVVLSVIITNTQWDAIHDGSADPALLAAVDQAPQAVRDLLTHPRTADRLDDTPAALPPPARLAEFIAVRDRHPVNPGAGPTAAAAADIDHTISVRDGGTTIADNLASLVRRWHNLKTHGGWSVTRIDRGWQWTSPRGHTYQTQPYDYRLGP